jgi:pimeloyl-ACP methyl ester carboxylesterase
MYSYQSNANNVKNKKGDYVILLHGIARSSNHMKPIEKYLTAKNYDVININYPSTDHKIEDLIDIIYKILDQNITESKKINFIGYSMGGLVTRALIHKYRPKNLNKVILLAPPNRGSEVADFFKNNFLYKKIYGKSGQELTTKDNKNLEKILGIVDYPLGIIAGNFTIDPISSYLIPGDDDGKVSIKSTKIDNMTDHIVISVSHTFFPSNKNVHKQILYFLEYGSFFRIKD